MRLKVEAIPTGAISSISHWASAASPPAIENLRPGKSLARSTICLHVIAEAQRMAGPVHLSTSGMRWIPDYASKIGVNVDDLYVSQPDTGEQALEIAEALVRSGTMDVVVVEKLSGRPVPR